MKYLPLLFSCIAFSANAQTPEAQIAVKVAEIQAICESAGLPNCFIITKNGTCPDPLVGTRASMQQAVVNVTATQEAIVGMQAWLNNLNTRELEQAKQAIIQALEGNP